MFDVKKYIASLGNPTEITKLDLSYKNITHLDEDTFVNLTQLERLWLNGNQLTSLSPNLFENLTQLEWLSLSGNQLTNIPPKIFENLTQLEWLYLYGNKLTTLPPNLFENSTQLKWLYLEGNHLSILPPKIFENLNQLKRLDLGGNQLTTLPLVNDNCWIAGGEEIEERRKDKEEHWKKWKYVGATLESLPPNPSNYCHLPVFTETFLGLEGGVDWVRGLEEFEELKNEFEDIE